MMKGFNHSNVAAKSRTQSRPGEEAVANAAAPNDPRKENNFDMETEVRNTRV